MPLVTESDRFALALPGRCLPAVTGAAAALLLGVAGFALGCVFGGLAPRPVPDAAAVAALGPAAGPGDPDERDPGAALRPAALVTDAATLSMARPVSGGFISSGYGQRLDPFTGLPAPHRGVDFTGLSNSSILAVASGVVAWSGAKPGYGNLIEIDHGHGWVTRYGHNALNLVAPGDYVKPGQTIALMGATGRATGTHLHFEVRYRGRAVNPARYIPRST